MKEHHNIIREAFALPFHNAPSSVSIAVSPKVQVNAQEGCSTTNMASTSKDVTQCETISTNNKTCLVGSHVQFSHEPSNQGEGSVHNSFKFAANTGPESSKYLEESTKASGNESQESFDVPHQVQENNEGTMEELDCAGSIADDWGDSIEKYSPMPMLHEHQQGAPLSASFVSEQSIYCSQSRRERKRSSADESLDQESESSKKRLAGKNSSRFLWSPELNAQFCSSVFQVGLKQALPGAVLAKMKSIAAQEGNGASSTLDGVNAEQISDYLDQYRNLQTEMFTVKHAEDRPNALDVPVSNLLLEHTKEPGLENIPDKEKGFLGDVEYEVLPSLDITADDLKSPAGTAMGYLLGMIHSTSAQLLKERVTNQKSLHISSDASQPSNRRQSFKVRHTAFNHGQHATRKVITKEQTKNALLSGLNLYSALQAKESPKPEH